MARSGSIDLTMSKAQDVKTALPVAKSDRHNRGAQKRALADARAPIRPRKTYYGICLADLSATASAHAARAPASFLARLWCNFVEFDPITAVRVTVKQEIRRADRFHFLARTRDR